MRFTPRVVLSCLLLLALLAGACDASATNGGLGTSPSEPTSTSDDDPIDQVQLPLATAPKPCGIWVDVSEAAADARAHAGDPPDILVFTQGHTTCADALAISSMSWPGRAVVRYATHSWRAAVLNMHPPNLAAPALLLRAPSPPTIRVPELRELREAAIPLLAPLAAFALSKEGLLLIGSAFAWLWRKVVKDDRRRATIANYADQAFHAAESMGVYQKLDGQGKYKVFIQTIVDALAADKAPDLSATEMAGLFELAKRKAWVGKLLVPPPSASSGR